MRPEEFSMSEITGTTEADGTIIQLEELDGKLYYSYGMLELYPKGFYFSLHDGRLIGPYATLQAAKREYFDYINWGIGV